MQRVAQCDRARVLAESATYADHYKVRSYKHDQRLAHIIENRRDSWQAIGLARANNQNSNNRHADERHIPELAYALGKDTEQIVVIGKLGEERTRCTAVGETDIYDIYCIDYKPQYVRHEQHPQRHALIDFVLAPTSRQGQ